MGNILTILRKELLDTFRDRRTLIVMIVIPLLLFPIMLNVATRISARQQKKAEIKVLNLGLISRDNVPTFKDIARDRKDIRIIEDIQEDRIPDLIQNGRLDFALVFEPDFDVKIAQKQAARVHFFYKSSRETDISQKRIINLLSSFEDQLVSERFLALKLDKSITDAFQIQNHDVASIKQKIGEVIGGFLPYIFVIFCFTGAMYPAIDLGAGEKERGTIETLLTSPANRFHIVMGKFIVILLAGITSAAVSILGLYFSIRLSRDIPPELLDSLLKIIDYQSIVLVFSLLIPLCIFFAGLLLSISIFAHSFKEAQSMMTPLNILVIFPVFVGLFPGIELNTFTAVIPVLNVSLATKEIISGTIEFKLLLLVYLSLFVIAAISLFFCVKWFQREQVIFRSN